MSTPDVEYDVTLNSNKFNKGQKDVNNQFRKMKISADQFGKSTVMSLSTIALGAGGAVIAFKAFSEVIDLVNVGVEKFNIQQKAETTLAQTLKSTGYAAGLTAFEIKKMASELQGITTYGDEAIIASSSLLLTFKNIGEDVFPDAQKAILNVSAAMGQDLKSSSLQIGKALNDPVAGITALTRVGITFTDEQKKSIKGFVEQNDIISAQAVLLKELESQFGGVAEAQAKTFEGINKQLDNYIGDIQESIGEGFTDEMTEPIQNLLNSLVDASPELADLAKSFGEIAGFIVSVPTNALTGWIDLFHASMAGTTASIGNKQIKNIAKEYDLIGSEISAQLGTYGLTDGNKSLEKLGGAKEVRNMFLDAYLGDDKAFNKIFDDAELLEVYRNLKGNLKSYDMAVAEHKRVLNIESEQVAKGADLGGNTKSAKTSISSDPFLEKMFADTGGDPDDYELLSTLSNYSPQGYKTREGDNNIYNDDAERRLKLITIGWNNALELQQSGNEDMLAQQAKFYTDSISILDSSNNVIIGFHQALTSGDTSSVLGGLSSGVGGISGILGTLGYVDPSGITGILSGALNIGSTIAGFFGSDSSTSTALSAEQQYETATSKRANIVSSGPENLYVTNNVNVYSSYIGQEGLEDFAINELAPILSDSVRASV